MPLRKVHAARRDVNAAMRRGAAGHCPHCGTGRLFDGYLTVVQRCSNCDEPLGEYRAADGPTFFTISIVGLLLVPLLGFGFVFFRPHPGVLLVATAVIATVLTIILLRPIKGAFVAYLWAHHERDPGA